MDKRPIRRKFEDNPYILQSVEKNNKYIVSFKDYSGRFHSVQVDKNIFDIFDENERYENARFFEYSKHLLHDEFNEEIIPSDYSIEDEVINNIVFQNLKKIIEQLPEKQKVRLKKYYFEGKNLNEIAKEECCSNVAVKYSIELAIKNIIKKLKQ